MGLGVLVVWVRKSQVSTLNIPGGSGAVQGVRVGDLGRRLHRGEVGVRIQEKVAEEIKSRRI